MSGNALHLGKIAVLIAEDNQFMRQIIKLTLRAFNCRLMRDAETGAKAWELIESGQFAPDIIFLDWNMPDMSGIELTRRVRTDPKSPNPFIPIILISAHSEQSKIYEALDAGVNEILVKPITAKGLYARIAAVVSRPREFVRTKDFFGPNRRRRANPDFKGPERRNAASTGMTQDEVNDLMKDANK